MGACTAGPKIVDSGCLEGRPLWCVGRELSGDWSSLVDALIYLNAVLFIAAKGRDYKLALMR